MNISFEELRNLKHQLPTGSVGKIASELELEEQTVRNFFGAQKYANGKITGLHIQPGPNGGIVNIEDTRIITAAKKILREKNMQTA